MYIYNIKWLSMATYIVAIVAFVIFDDEICIE